MSRAMESEYVIKESPEELKACPFCGKKAMLRYAKGTSTYKGDSNVAPYKRKVGPPTLRTNFRGNHVCLQKYEWDIWLVGCVNDECLGFGHLKYHDELKAVNAWNTRKGEAYET